MKRVYIDYDNTMFDFMSALDKYMIKTRGKSINKKNIVTYDFNKNLSKVPVRMLYSLMVENDLDVRDFYNVIATGECTQLTNGISADDIISSLGQVELYAESPCLVDKDKLVTLFTLGRAEHICPVVNSGLIAGSTLSKIIEVKKKRVAELFGNLPYEEVYTIGKKPVYQDASVVIDDDLGYLCRYIEADSDALLILINQSYNQYTYNPQYDMAKSKIQRVSNINSALSLIDSHFNLGLRM